MAQGHTLPRGLMPAKGSPTGYEGPMVIAILELRTGPHYTTAPRGVSVAKTIRRVSHGDCRACDGVPWWGYPTTGPEVRNALLPQDSNWGWAFAE